jgi:hypothetical protein
MVASGSRGGGGSVSGGDRMAVLILAPECGMEGLISRIGRLLGEAGFNPRSAGVIPGARQFVDHIYRTGPTRATDRVQSLPAAFLSYMAPSPEPFAPCPGAAARCTLSSTFQIRR